MSTKIRRALPGDAADLAELAERTFRHTFAADNSPEEMELHVADSYGTARQHEELVNPDITTLLVDIDGELAGFAQLRSGAAPECVTGKSPVELWRFYVAHEYHGRGIAQSLMSNVEREAYRRGGRTLWLGVWERNERAKAFYRKAGFVDVGSHIFMVGNDPQTDRIMVKSLSTNVPNGGTADSEG